MPNTVAPRKGRVDWNTISKTLRTKIESVAPRKGRVDWNLLIRCGECGKLHGRAPQGARGLK